MSQTEIELARAELEAIQQRLQALVTHLRGSNAMVECLNRGVSDRIWLGIQNAEQIAVDMQELGSRFRPAVEAGDILGAYSSLRQAS
jgi:hypothetical protein